ncbi:small ubiquitin-related modifier 3-like [Microtus oregoni]|uniref:small ubiquitin-related modifier 3-like n=1 Tax=Microtus oregoni TaxID=111838 RepID=UPI001BB202C4|nr:small ubiquitin-related modifier 3-like [Microtus oregoni]
MRKATPAVCFRPLIHIIIIQTTRLECQGKRQIAESAAINHGHSDQLPVSVVLPVLPAATAAQPCQEKPKEGVKTENDHINLKVAGQDGSVVQFKIKRHTPLSKLMKAYCERQGLSMRQIRFRFDGQPIHETDTPAQLEMEEEDTIDVFQQQTGGTASRGTVLTPDHCLDICY